ncbi:sulfatase-like hydrolase/transferase [Mollicutes bacterium LVI A0075]|nr:sulfatase-like hydrolase/transferase [Mollicutes bacterium LVI A0075]
MNLFTGIIFIYLMFMLLLLHLFSIHSIGLLSIIMIATTAVLYTTLISYLPTSVKKILNGIIISFILVLTIGNIAYFYIKNSVLTVSLLALLDELAGVSDVALGYLQPVYAVVLIIPITFIILSNKAMKKTGSVYSKKVIASCIALLAVTNLAFYIQDELLYTTVYNPVEYAQKYGFISFYARDLLPFTKSNLSDVEYENTVESSPSNSYSGLLEDKTNVVYVTAESLDDIAIDETLTPTLYKMASDGIFFENYYNLTNNTNASEFSSLTSAHPPIDNSHLEDFSGTINSLPDLFNADDFCTFSFHLNRASYYARDEVYSKIYDFTYSYFSDDLYPEATLNDARDELLFELSTKFIEEQECEKNFTYYMSYYGHASYDIETRPSAESDFEYVNSVYPDNDQYLNAYLAYQISLDKMLEDMINYYTEQGLINDTVFIVIADHYPYELGDPEHKTGEYSDPFLNQSFSGDAYETYNVPFLIYDPTQKLDNNQEYMSNVDVLPTIADLFGLNYEYSEGKSAFDDSVDGQIKWLGIENFGILSEDRVYPSEDPSSDTLAEVEDDKLQAAKLYSLFD